MAYREVTRMEIKEVIRRWQLGLSQRQIARGTGVSRPTVRRYLAAAVELGPSADGPEPDEAQLARLAALSLAGPRRTDAPSEEQLTPWAEQIQVWLTAERLQMTRIHELLRERGCAVSYNSLRRFSQHRGRSRRPVTMPEWSPAAVGWLVASAFEAALSLQPAPQTLLVRVSRQDQT